MRGYHAVGAADVATRAASVADDLSIVFVAIQM